METREWCFTFRDEIALRVASPWRLMAGGRIELGWQDHGQLFGLAKPLDGPARAASLIGGAEVESAEICSSSGDLAITFMNGSELQVFNGSCGHEGWQLRGPGTRTVVCQGGGNVESLK